MASSRSSAGSRAQARTVRSSRSRGASTRARTKAVTGSTIRARIRRRRDLSSHRPPFAGPVDSRGRGAAVKLGNQAVATAAPVVEEALKKESNRWVRHALAEALALIHLANGTPTQRTAAAHSLGDLHSESAVPALQRLATDSGASA